ncbi:hypothetical protein [Pedobacter sp. JY14-1]|uniref:hypothetical protein n=1 Tax=Pedobacter sp. JY14-1 TaxID=3034151 RepID=UPI0023E1D15A|nr:hypothetical protein [Pedobacter sp. JY14-1]
MQPVPLTAEVLAQKVLGRSNDKIWIDWAYQMLLEGFETEHLLILAGMMPPLYHQELTKLTDKVLAELGLDYSDREEVVCRYVAYLSKLAVTGNRCRNIFYVMLDK